MARKRLVTLRKRAITASQWISIAKRERSLNAWDEAAETLNLARFKMPANDMVLALLVDTLARGGRVGEAITRSTDLAGSTFAVQGAAVRFLDPGSERDPRWWEIAAEASGSRVFMRNAAVWYAASGNIPAACASAAAAFSTVGGYGEVAIGPSERRMLASLYYDAGFPEQAMRTLIPSVEEKPAGNADPRDLELLADCSLEGGDTEGAARFWSVLTDSFPGRSPVAWYNLSVVAMSAESSNGYLTALLDRFPTYFPGISRFVGNYLGSEPSPEKDSLTKELETRGFYSLSMKENERVFVPVREDVGRRLETAIASSAGSPDIRFFIEEAKVSERESRDSTLSTSRIWNLLERYSSNDLLIRYAMWFFLRTGQAETAFSLNRERTAASDPFYDALEAAAKGDLGEAEAAFNKCADSKEDSWAALANIAMIREREGDFAAAVDYFDRATSFAPNDIAASDLQYDAALILSRSQDTRRAQQVLMRALELDPGNERAEAALRRLQGF